VDRARIALLEAEIAQMCYHLSLLRAEHRRLRGRIAAVEATAVIVGNERSEPK
jgi:hypothetical protein